MAKHYSFEKLKKIHARYLKGESLRTLGHIYDCSHFFLRNKFRELDFKLYTIKEAMKRLGEKQTGKNHPKWIGGRSMSKSTDQIKINIGKNNQVLESHYVYCKAYNIPSIPKGFVIHHLDHDPSNNNIDNLMLLTTGDHLKLHRYLETRKRDLLGRFTSYNIVGVESG